MNEWIEMMLQDMAMLSSATACAPITAHNTTGSVTNLVAFSATDGTTSPVGATSAPFPGGSGEPPRHNHHGLAERFHGLTERIGSLGHSRTESDVSNRTRTGIYTVTISFSFLLIFEFLIQNGLLGLNIRFSMN